MNGFILAIGIALVLWALVEALWTTIWVDGSSAPLTGKFTSLVWKLFRLSIKKRKDRLLSLAGPTVLFFCVTSWIMFLWLGWVLIFYADQNSLLVNKTNTLPDFTDVIWFVAYTMFTVGNGDFSPQGDVWQVVSAFVAFSGLSVATLSFTYIIQVISAVASKRAFSSQVTSIGKTPEEFVQKQWTRGGLP